MSSAATLKKTALLVFAFAVLATSVKANELWVAPAKNSADKLIADFAVAQKRTRFGFGVPDNFNGFTRATVLLIGSKDQEIRYDLTLSISRNLASDTASVTVMNDIPALVFKDQLLELDVSAIFNGAPALEPGADYVSLSIDIGNARIKRHGEREGEDQRSESSSNDTGNPHGLLFGLRFQYEGPVGPAGPQGPKGDEGPQGIPGPPGAAGGMGDPGVPGLNWKGAWDPQASYVPSDSVLHGGSAYVAVGPSVGSQPPNADWSLLASKGDQGEQGVTGAPGIQGLQGSQGIQGPPGPAGAAGIVPGATELAAAIYRVPQNECGVAAGMLTTDPSCTHASAPACPTALFGPPPSNCPDGEESTQTSVSSQPSSVCVSTYNYQCNFYTYQCNPRQCNPYSCNPRQCNPYTCGSYQCEPHACNCNLFGCSTCYNTCYSTCYSTCYDTCYNTCYDTCTGYSICQGCNAYAPEYTACYSCTTPFTLLGKLVK